MKFFFHGIVLIIVLMAQSLQATDFVPVFSKTTNGSCLLIGNTNTELAVDNHTSLEEEKKELKHILNYPVNNQALSYTSVESLTSTPITITNVNYASFCIPNPDPTCDSVRILSARLNWAGRINKGVTLGNKEQVYVKITDGGGNDLSTSLPSCSGYYLVPADVTNNQIISNSVSDGFYNCHADVTELLNGLISKSVLNFNSLHRIYVANVVSELLPFGTDGLFSGWSLSIVYEHKSLSKRNIMVYDCDALGISNTNGGENKALLCNFKFGNASPYLLNDTITMGFSMFGSYANIYNGELLSNKDLILTETSFRKDSPKAIRTVGSGGVVDSDPLSNSIYCSYKGTCAVTEDVPYTRGYDLHMSVLDPGKYDYINKNDSSFNVAFLPINEFHYLTNAVVETGAPDVPQVNLEMESPKPDVTPGDEIPLNLYVTAGNNKENLNGIKINIPLSEYIDSITGISFLFDSQVRISGNSTVRLNIKDGASSEQYLGNLISVNPRVSSMAKAGLLSAVNEYLAKLDKDNQALAAIDPSHLKNALITLAFPDIEIPRTLSGADAITIQLKIKTKKANSWVYEKNTKVAGNSATIVPQPEMDVNGAESGQSSIIEGTGERGTNWGKYECENALGGNGGSGGGGGAGGFGGACSGLADDTVSSSGVYVKDKANNKISVKIRATGRCMALPDSVSLYFCENTQVSVSDIKLMLKNKYKLNIDSIAKSDSCLWVQVKRDSIAKFASRYGVNKSKMETLLGSAQDGMSISTGNDSIRLADLMRCGSGLQDVKLLTDTIDSILQMKVRVSDVTLFYAKQDTQFFFQKSKAFSLRNDVASDEMYTVKDDTTAYLYFNSPWTSGNGATSCSGFISVHFHKSKINAPLLVYQNDTLADGDTVFLCKDAEPKPLTVLKGKNEYDVLADIVDTVGVRHSNLLVDRSYALAPQWQFTTDSIIRTSVPGTSKVLIRQKSFGKNCLSDSALLFVKVADFKIDKKPQIDKSLTDFCENVIPEDSLHLKVIKDLSVQNYAVRWYAMTKDSLASLSLIGDGDSVAVPKDTAGVRLYTASYYLDRCESKFDTVAITIHPKADSIKSDTMTICQYYKLTTTDVLKFLKKENPGLADVDKLRFYKYEDITNNTETNIQKSLAADTLMLSNLLTAIDDSSDCGKAGYRMSRFVVQNVTPIWQCPGAGSLICVKTVCYDRTPPSFIGNVDSVLYCMGDLASANLNDFVSIQEKNLNAGSKWFWYEEGAALPYNQFYSDQYAQIPQSDPQTNTSRANIRFYSVVRVDSNSCVSDADTFRVIVDNSINTYPKIGDTTKIISINETLFSLNYCKGENPYESDTVPVLGYPARNYQTEWYEKNKIAGDCDSVLFTGTVKKNSIVADFQYPDTTYYCVRQTTPMGCKGPWLNVQLIVNDSVRSLPKSVSHELCEGADSVLVEMPELSTEQFRPTYYDAGRHVVSGSRAYIKSDSVGSFISANGNNLFYVSLTDKNTGCRSQVVGIDAVVYPRPHLPVLVNDSSLYLCAANDVANLTLQTGAKTDIRDDNTKLVWTPSDTVSLAKEGRLFYSVRQQDTISQCMGPEIKVTANVENTFEYIPLKSIVHCYGEAVNLADSISSHLTISNKLIPVAKVGYKVFRLYGDTPSARASDIGSISKLVSEKGKNVNDTLHYLVEVLDSVSRCFQSDTVSLIFNGLPSLPVIGEISACQYADIMLPTPHDRKCQYFWLRENGMTLPQSSTSLQLATSERLRLVATDVRGCVDTLWVGFHIDSLPLAPHAVSDTFCQHTGLQPLQASVRASSANPLSNLSLQWFDPLLDSVPNAMNTDTVKLYSQKNVRRYTVRQTNLMTGCFSDTSINVTLYKALHLAMPDLPKVCYPEVVNLDMQVKNYLSHNLATINLPNLQGVTLQYAKLDGGRKSLLTDEAAAALTYNQNRDTVAYEYLITDADGVCSAADTVSVPIYGRPSAPIIANGTDTVYFCKNNPPYLLHAMNTNTAADTLSEHIYWNGNHKGDTYAVSLQDNDKIQYAFVQNEQSGCVGDYDTVLPLFVSPISVSSIGSDGVIVRCAGSSVNVWDTLASAFSIDVRPGSHISYEAFADGKPAYQADLLSVVRTGQDTIKYVMTVVDALTGCEASDSLILVFHAAPVSKIAGATSICKGDTLDLNVVGDNRQIRYEWSLGGMTLSTDRKLLTDRLTCDTVLMLTSSLVGTFCRDTLYQSVIVNERPARLDSQRLSLCLHSGIVNLPIDYNSSRYALLVEDESGDSLNHISINTEMARRYWYRVRLQDLMSGCLGKSADIVATVHPLPLLDLPPQPQVCEPAVVHLQSLAVNTFNMENGAVGETKIADSVYVNSGGMAVSAPDSVAVSGKYQVTIVDQYGCVATDTLSLTINRQPAMLTGDTSFCQNTGSHLLSGGPIAVGCKAEWLNLESAYPDSLYTDSVMVDTKLSGNIYYQIRQTSINGNCHSKPSPVRVTIHPSIIPGLRDTSICAGSTLDILSYARRHLRGGTSPYVDKCVRMVPLQNLNYSAIEQSGRFIVVYADSNNCHAQDSLSLHVASPVHLVVDAPSSVCAGEDIRLHAAGTEYYLWNKVYDSDTLTISTTVPDSVHIALQAGFVLDSTLHTGCSVDTQFVVAVNRVPDLLIPSGDTSYCQNSVTEPLTLTPADTAARLLWYSPSDSYRTSSENGTLIPSSKTEGAYIYKYRQMLGHCFSPMQNYVVNIQPAIAELPVVSDTSYCKGEKAAPLSAQWQSPQYSVKWSDKDGNSLPTPFAPPTDLAGSQIYKAKLDYKVCQSKEVEMRIVVRDRYPSLPDVPDSFVFCRNSGMHLLSLRTQPAGTMVNWYHGTDDRPVDSVSVNSDAVLWKKDSFRVSLSQLKGCAGPERMVSVIIAEGLTPLSLSVDTCANTKLFTSDVLARYQKNVVEDTLWLLQPQKKRLDLNANIGYSGRYAIAVTDANGCKATHVLQVNMIEPENFSYPDVSQIYCPYDTVTLHASASNATMEWKDLQIGKVGYGDTYSAEIEEPGDVLLIATMNMNKACMDTVRIHLQTYVPTSPLVVGDTAVCVGADVQLSSKNLFRSVWTVNDTVASGDVFSFVPSQSTVVSLVGVDKNQCKVKKNIPITVIPILSPQILVHPLIHSEKYQLNKDTTEIELEGITSAPVDGHYSFYWNFGDGSSVLGGKLEQHTYSRKLVMLNLPIEVTLKVRHDFGCEGDASILLQTDPDFKVPNTMTSEDDFMPDYYLQIFDRIGNLIYDGDGWKGKKNNGEDAFADTYFYAITYYVGGGKRIKTGYITLVR